LATKKQAASVEVLDKAERTPTKKAATKRAVKASKPAATRSSARSAASSEPAKRRTKTATAASPKRTTKRAADLATPRKPRRVPAAPAEASPEVRDLALAIAAAGMDKKALGIEILDVTGKVDYADFLVVMTGRSDRHVHAIAVGLDEALRRKKHAPLSVEGLTAATWVLLDFGDVVVHVFQEDARRLYDIEGLWIDASRVPVPADAAEDRARAEL
jgi:ribosome-associated protein